MIKIVICGFHQLQTPNIVFGMVQMAVLFLKIALIFKEQLIHAQNLLL